MISIPVSFTVEVIYANSITAPQRLHACQCKFCFNNSPATPYLPMNLGPRDPAKDWQDQSRRRDGRPPRDEERHVVNCSPSKSIESPDRVNGANSFREIFVLHRNNLDQDKKPGSSRQTLM